MGSSDEAASHLKLSLELADPDQEYEEHAYCGLFFRQMKRYEESIREFDEALRLQPPRYKKREPGGYTLQRGISLARAGQFERAIADFSAVIANNSDSDLAYEERASAYEAIGKKDEAGDDRQKVRQLRKKPND
jgi:tetratricopeptide (TPR) repeat protein